MSAETIAALQQFYEASQIMRSATKPADVAEAMAAMNEAEQALWALKQKPDFSAPEGGADRRMNRPFQSIPGVAYPPQPEADRYCFPRGKDHPNAPVLRNGFYVSRVWLRRKKAERRAVR